jgi:hypothetical protein
MLPMCEGIGNSSTGFGELRRRAGAFVLCASARLCWLRRGCWKAAKP